MGRPGLVARAVIFDETGYGDITGRRGIERAFKRGLVRQLVVPLGRFLRGQQGISKAILGVSGLSVLGWMLA